MIRRGVLVRVSGFVLLGLVLLGGGIYHAWPRSSPPPTPNPYSFSTAQKIFRSPEVNCAMMAEAANHFVAQGEGEALKELRGLASIRNSAGYVDGFERFGYMCRILFVPKGSEPLREPAFGGLPLPYDSMPENDWPLLPLASSGSSYFVLSDRYIIQGLPEDPLDYIDYCARNGTFRTTSVPVPKRAQALADAAALRSSPAWKAAKLDEAGTWTAIQRQAELTPP